MRCFVPQRFSIFATVDFVVIDLSILRRQLTIVAAVKVRFGHHAGDGQLSLHPSSSGMLP